MSSAEMQWPGRTVVVTGAARGIGAAIATRLRSLGAEVVASDVREADLLATAERADLYPVVADISTEDGVADLVTRAKSHLGGDIDVWVGNAGVALGEGLDSPDADWSDSWSINVMAHVRAARLLIPDWLERGQGRFVVTASAAGLLTILGQPTYAVTKHGAEAFAEWLSATYGHRGIAVHAICPQGVRTDMYPGPNDGALADVIGHDGALQPDDVATSLVDAIDRGDFLVLPHPEVKDYFAFRGADTAKWLRGMQRLQGRIDQLGERA